MSRLRAPALGICLLPVLLTACDGQPSVVDPRTQPPLVRVIEAGQATDVDRAFTGVVAARVQSDLGFRVGGKVVERFVDAGQSVSRGQRLMRLDPADLALQSNAREQAVVAAQALATQTANDERRNRQLVASGAISAANYDRFKSAADTARADLVALQAQAAVGRNEASYATLTADSDGVVVATLAEPGQVVSAGQPVVKLAKAGPREAVVQLPETLRPAPGSTAQARLFGSSGNSVSATLRQLADAADPLTRTFEARYVLTGEQANAPLGSTVTLAIAPTPSVADALSVPMAAIHDPGNGPGVWIVAGTPAVIAWRSIQVVGLGDDTATVRGVRPGERLVALGPHLLHEGEEVLVAPQDLRVQAGSQP